LVLIYKIDEEQSYGTTGKKSVKQKHQQKIGYVVPLVGDIRCDNNFLKAPKKFPKSKHKEKKHGQ
jgi:hypothetical protein